MTCNLTPRPYVEWLATGGRALLRIALLALLVALWGNRAGAAPSTLDRAEQAARQIDAGDLRAAAGTVRQALDADPGDPVLHSLAATLLTLTGDTVGAESEWTVVQRDSQSDSLADYGLGLVALWRRDLAGASVRFTRASATGDGTVCLLASRYVDAVQGAIGGGVGLAAPEAYLGAARGLSGYNAERMGDHQRALRDIADALARLPGDPFAEPTGILMTFDDRTPLRSGWPALPSGSNLAVARGQRTDRGVSGLVTLSTEDTDSDTGGVVYRIDGSLSALVNTQPYRYTWNTAKAPNGLHRVEIIIYDRGGREAFRTTRDVRTYNEAAPARSAADAARVVKVRSVLWRALCPQPSRAALSYAAYEASRALANSAEADRYLKLAGAADPAYRDVRTRLASQRIAADPALWRGATNDMCVALTFDDGPKPGITEALLDVLVREKTPATFFVIGRHATAYPELIRKIALAGMELGNHSYTHPNLALTSEQTVERELLRTSVSIESVTGRPVRYFRPPGGNLNADVTRVAARLGLTPCMWTVDGERLEKTTADQLVQFVVNRTTPGAVILLHNGRMTTVEALPRIIAGLRRRGFRFTTVDDLAQRKASALALTGAPRVAH